MVTATYPGTFDPMTLGHLDLVRRAARVFPRLLVAVAESRRKHTLFSLEERVEIARNTTQSLPNVEVFGFSGLLVDFIREHDSKCIIRGARAVSDFDYEFQMAGMNQILMPDVDTIFLTPAQQFQFVSGTFVREIASMGGDVTSFVTPEVALKLKEKYQNPK